ncbi:MAG TPA: hypothetical protein VGZ00_10530 [Candidatus Baltobacteraceae bacterium]|jgi:hypothetical protein|nr:hypothetical protein [Candidatus Baltobacteraceae bacterium]
MQNAIIIGEQRDRYVEESSLPILQPSGSASASVLSRYFQNAVDGTIVYTERNGMRRAFTDCGGRITFEASTSRFDIQVASALAGEYAQDYSKAITLEGDPKFIALATSILRKQGILLINHEIDTLFARKICAIAGPPDALAEGPVSLDGGPLIDPKPEFFLASNGSGKVQIRNASSVAGNHFLSSVFTIERSPNLVVYRKVHSESRTESSRPCIADTGKRLLLLNDGTFDRQGSHDPGAIWLLLVLAAEKREWGKTIVPLIDGTNQVAQAFMDYLLPEAVRQGIALVDSPYLVRYHELKEKFDAFRQKIAERYDSSREKSARSPTPADRHAQETLWVYRQQFRKDSSYENLDLFDRVLLAFEGPSDQYPLGSDPDSKQVERSIAGPSIRPNVAGSLPERKRSTPVEYISAITPNSTSATKVQPTATPERYSPRASRAFSASAEIPPDHRISLRANTALTPENIVLPSALEGFPGKTLLQGWFHLHGRNDDRVRGIKHFLNSMGDNPIDITASNTAILCLQIHRWTNGLFAEMKDKGMAKDTLLDRTQAVTSLLMYGRMSGLLSRDVVDAAIVVLKNGEDALKLAEPKIPEEFLRRVEYPLLKVWCDENRERSHLFGPVFQFIKGIESESNITKDEFKDTKKVINEWYRRDVEKSSSVTVRKHLSGVRSFFEYGLDHGFLSLGIVSAARSALDELREKVKRRQLNDETPLSMRVGKDEPLIFAWRQEQVRRSAIFHKAVERFLEDSPEIVATSDPALLCKHIEAWTTRLEEKILDRVWSFRTVLDHFQAVRSLFTFAQTREFIDSRAAMVLKSALEAQEGRLTLRYSNPPTESLRKGERELVEGWCRENFNSPCIAPVIQFVKDAAVALVDVRSIDVTNWSEEYLKRVDSHKMSPFTFHRTIDGVRSLFEYGRRRGAFLDWVVDEIRLTLDAIQDGLNGRKMEILISRVVDHPNKDLVAAWCQMSPQIQQGYVNGITRLFKGNPINFMKLDAKELGTRLAYFVEQLNHEVRVKRIAPRSAQELVRGGVSFFSYCRIHEPTQVGITDSVMSILKNASVSFRREDILLRQRPSMESSKKQSSIR